MTTARAIERRLAQGVGLATGTARFEEGVYWIDLVRDVGYSVTHRRSERYPLGDYVRPYTRRHVYAVPSWRDPAPFLQECRSLLTRLKRSGGDGPPNAAEPIPATNGVER